MNRFGLGGRFDYVCTAGGAMVQFLSGKPMPVIEALKASADALPWTRRAARAGAVASGDGAASAAGGLHARVRPRAARAARARRGTSWTSSVRAATRRRRPRLEDELAFVRAALAAPIGAPRSRELAAAAGSAADRRQRRHAAVPDVPLPAARARRARGRSRPSA